MSENIIKPVVVAKPKIIIKSKKKKSRKGLIFGIIFLLIAATTSYILLKPKKDEGISIETEKISKRTVLQTVTATGIIDPDLQLKVTSEVSGEIIFLGVKEGDFVHKGQVIIKVNPQSFSAERDQAEAQVSSSLARVAQSEASLLRAIQEQTRIQGLYEKKLATTRELEITQSQVKIAEAEKLSSRYNVDQARAGVRRIMESLKKTTITAPISGVVTKLITKLGEKVVGAIQMSGTEIMTIADLSVIEAVVDVPETDVVQISLNDIADIEVDAIPNKKFKAVVSRIANSPKKSGLGTNEQMTNFEVRLRFINKDERLRPGLTSTATIGTDKKENVLTVPIQSVTTRDPKKESKKENSSKDDKEKEKEKNEDVKNVKLELNQKDKPKPIVFLKMGDSVVIKSVETGIRDDQYIEISSGLKENDEVVIGTYKAISQELEQGSKVKLEEKKKDKKESKK
jgi:HlyD family secretion protein